MRVFIDPYEVQRNGFLKKLWVVLPIDLQAFCNLWHRSESAKKDEPNLSIQLMASQQSADENKSKNKEKWILGLGASFLDKILQIQFHVPEPVLIKWQEYLTDCLHEAFPKLPKDNDDFRLVFRIIHQSLPSDRLLAPRHIKRIVNRLVALYRLNQETALPILAIYSVFAEAIESGAPDFSSTELIPRQVVNLISEQYLREYEINIHLAALRYQIPIKDAVHICLAPKIEAYLKTGDSDSISQLEKIAGFYPVCEYIVENWCAMELPAPPVLLLQTAAALDNLPRNHHLDKMKRQICKGVITLSDFKYISSAEVRGTICLLKNAKSGLTDFESYLAAFLDKLSNSFPGTKTVSSWVDLIIIILQFLSPDYKNIIRGHFRIKPEPPAFAEFVWELSKRYLQDEEIALLKPQIEYTPTGNQHFDNILGLMGKQQFSECLTNPAYILERWSANWPPSNKLNNLKDVLIRVTEQMKPGFLGQLHTFTSLVIHLWGSERAKLIDVLKHENFMNNLMQLDQDEQPQGNGMNSPSVAYYSFLRLTFHDETYKPQNNPTKLDHIFMKLLADQNMPQMIENIARLVIQHRVELRISDLNVPEYGRLKIAVLEQVKRIADEEMIRRQEEYAKAVLSHGSGGLAVFINPVK
jgi:hypothetical protein